MALEYDTYKSPDGEDVRIEFWDDDMDGVPTYFGYIHIQPNTHRVVFIPSTDAPGLTAADLDQISSIIRRLEQEDANGDK